MRDNQAAVMRHQIRRPAFMPIPLMVLTVCLSGCIEPADAKREAGGLLGPSLSAPVTTDSLCTRLEFTMLENGTVTAVFPNRTTCGTGMILIPGGAPSRDNRTINLPVRLLNKSTAAVEIPLRALLPGANRLILNPSGWSGTHVQTLNQDSVIPNPERKLWLITPPGPVGVNDSSTSRTLQFNVDAGVKSARLSLVVEATQSADTARPVVPDTVAWPTTPLLVPSPLDASYSYFRDVFEVSFHDTTSGPGVRGFLSHFSATIIGGSFQTDPHPYYKIRVPDPGNSWASVDSLRAAMAAWPGIWVVGPSSFTRRIRPRGRYPIDNAVAPARATWRDPANAVLWPWRAISAPLAWGCETGVSGTNGIQVAVIDFFFEGGTPTDLSSSLTGGGGIVLPRTSDLVFDTTTASAYQQDPDHGFGVAGLVTAAGDNGQGIAGMVWTSNLTLYALFRSNMSAYNDFDVLERQLVDAAQRGVRVINISFGLGQPTDTVHRAQARAAFKKYLDSGVDRLLVVATGNHALTYTRAALAASTDTLIDLTDRVLAGLMADPAYQGKILWVTGVNQVGGKWVDAHGGANVWTGTEVVAAPSVGITSLAGVSGHGVWDGTSFAAPFVTGLAAQLWSMRPQMSAAEVKDYILRGAATSPMPHANIGVAGVDRIDAYQSLRLLAAEHSDAPLCGNRVWVQNLRSIVAERGATTQTIYTLPTVDTLGVAFPRHGGRRIDFQVWNKGPIEGLALNAGSWSRTSSMSFLPDSLASGTTWSFFGRTHDGDSATAPVSASFGGVGVSSAVFDVRLGTNTVTGRLLASMAPPLNPPATITGRQNAQLDSAGHFIQYVDDPSVQITSGSYQTGTVRTLPSPFGDRIIVVFNYLEHVATVSSAWVPGPTPIATDSTKSTYQVKTSTESVVSGKTKVWTIPWAGGIPLFLWERDVSSVAWMGLSESSPTAGSDAVMAIGRIDANAAAPGMGGYMSCSIEYVNVLTGIGTAGRPPRTAQPVTCAVGALEIGTFAPLRGTTGRGGVIIP